MIKIFVRLCVFLAILFTGLGAVGSVVLYLYIQDVEKNLTNIQKILEYKPQTPSKVMSQDGIVIGEFFNEKRYPKPLKEISPLLVKAFLAAEDNRFYEHPGVDIQGVIRAAIQYFLNKKTKQGGSTITQQLAKTLLLTKEKTLERKLKDILLALKIEQKLSKSEILEIYLNTIFLGNQSYGVEAAAQNYFHKNNQALSLAQCAIIAGLPPAPSAYAPTENFNKSKVRQRFVLEQMVKNKMISKEESEAASKEELVFYRAKSPNTQVAPHFLMEVKKQLEEQIKLPDLYTEGYTITTTLNGKLQQQAQKEMSQHLLTYGDRAAFRGPIAHHSPSQLPAQIQALEKSQDRDRAFVIDFLPELDAVVLATAEGLGLLTAEHHRWALKTTKLKNTDVRDFAMILKIGDEVHIQPLEKKLPIRFRGHMDILLKAYEGKHWSNTEPLYKLTDRETIEGGFMAMESQNGHVLSMVGGSDFSRSQFNRVTQARRQVGSSVKPLYYGFAMDHGFAPHSLLDSPPIVIGDWKPENYNNEVTERTTLRRALIRSYNLASVQLYQALNPTLLLDHFHNLGLKWPSADISLALGAGEATLLQLSHAYSAFPNQGKPVAPQYILKITKRDGTVIYNGTEPALKVLPPIDKEVFTPQAAFITIKMMEDVVRQGTGNYAYGLSSHTAGKTGTSNGYTDAWFMAVLPNLVSGIWMGYDDNRKSMGKLGTGGLMAAPLWKKIMKPFVQAYPPPSWQLPENIEMIKVNPETGEVYPKNASGGVIVPHMKGQKPLNALGIMGEETKDSTEDSIRNLL